MLRNEITSVNAESVINTMINHLREKRKGGFFYWLGTEYGPDGAWVFLFDSGIQTVYDKDASGFYAWAVRLGDVAAPVPEPALLLGSGPLGLVAYRKRLRRRHG